MNERRLHIISFDIPFPATYGGAIDVFYRLKALKNAGIKVTLHCTYKGELKHYDELESLCEKVYYYKRKTTILQQLSVLPYTVIGRKNNQLLNNLLQDDSPILFEGLVSCYYIDHPQLQQRKKYFRECNVEHDYYRALARITTSAWRKTFLLMEAWKLQRFEKKLHCATAIFALAHQDEEHFKTSFPQLPTYYVPCFHPNDSITSKPGNGNYILYHGNLDVAENIYAAQYIIHQIAPLIPEIPIIIAGRYSSAMSAIKDVRNVKHVLNPDNDKMRQLVEEAHIHLLITFQTTGLKLKLVNVLHQGRHVVVNPSMVCGTELGELCIIKDGAEQLAECCKTLINTPFTDEDISKREAILRTIDNTYLANELIKRIF